MPVSRLQQASSPGGRISIFSQVTAAGPDRNVLTLGVSPPPEGCGRQGLARRGGVPGDWTDGGSGRSLVGGASAGHLVRGPKDSLPGQPHTVEPQRMALLPLCIDTGQIFNLSIFALAY